MCLYYYNYSVKGGFWSFSFSLASSVTDHRRPKLTMRGVFFFFLNLYANVQRAKRDTVTADIYYYITTEFGYAKRDLRLAVCGGVVLQRFEFINVCMGKNGNRHYS